MAHSIDCIADLHGASSLGGWLHRWPALAPRFCCHDCHPTSPDKASICQVHIKAYELQVPPMSPDRVSRIIEQELDTTIEDLFESIDLKNPLGAASIAQVQGPHAQHADLAAAHFWPCASVSSNSALGSQAHQLAQLQPQGPGALLQQPTRPCCACKQLQLASLRGCKPALEGCHACTSALQVHKGKLRSSGIEVAVKVQYEDALEVSSLSD